MLAALRWATEATRRRGFFPPGGARELPRPHPADHTRHRPIFFFTLTFQKSTTLHYNIFLVNDRNHRAKLATVRRVVIASFFDTYLTVCHILRGGGIFTDTQFTHTYILGAS